MCSNSYRLERDHEWLGIAVEPSRQFEALKLNRKCCCLQTCISDKVETVTFVEDYLHGEHNHFSGIQKYADCHPQQGKHTSMSTETLAQVLRSQGAPKTIEYLSIDTEGSELMILSVFPFDEYMFRCITVEHNFVEPKRTQLHDLLVRNGYHRIELSATQWDDWYVHGSIMLER